MVASTMAFDELCVGKGQNSFIAHPDDCQMYILCQNEKALPARCPQPADQPEIWFDPNRGACAPRGDFCSPPPCEGLSGVFVPNTGADCGAWIYCLDSQPSHNNTCPYNLSFEANTQFCTYPMCENPTVPVASDQETPIVQM